METAQDVVDSSIAATTACARMPSPEGGPFGAAHVPPWVVSRLVVATNEFLDDGGAGSDRGPHRVSSYAVHPQTGEAQRPSAVLSDRAFQCEPTARRQGV